MNSDFHPLDAAAHPSAGWAHTSNETPVYTLQHQSWTADNLCVESFHEETGYYTSRWDALCPYIDVTPEMLDMAQKPFIVYALPPEGNYGVPINDKYGLVHAGSEDFWKDERRARKFRELDKLNKHFSVTEQLIAGKDMTVEQVFALGSEHFDAYEIHAKEVEGFVDYVRDLDVLVLQVHADNGDLVLTDVSMVLPERDQVYGSFCQWNTDYKNRSPGIYACLLAARWTAKHGYKYYNLGPVGDYGYKSLFVTDFEPIYGLAMTDVQHALALDPTSPLHTDFKPSEWNQIYRTRGN
ncbi:MAG: GNAT family N-acetyltransferase [Rhodoferax sp.]|nr:GNAT family N-acetyltransferase [Rhodoferax sp.]